MFANLTLLTAVLWAAEAFVLYLVATFCFDVVHWFLHQAQVSKSPLLQKLGGFHQTHHDFLGPNLKFDDRLIAQNFWRHRTGEYLTQMAGAALAFLVLDPIPVLATQALFTISFVGGIFMKGKDSNHQEVPIVPAPTGGIFVGLHYHCLHHLYPLRYFSSVTTAFDKIFGTGCQVAGRKVVITGASGSFGAPMKKILEREGATVTALKYGVDYQYNDYSAVDAALQGAEILVLAHGSKVKDAMAANCDSYLELISRFRAVTRGNQAPAEVWAVGSEIECHPSWGNAELEVYLQSKRAFARRARHLFHQRELLYRHIVPSAFTSPMGPGLISGSFAASWAWFLIKRGYRYVPVSYTGIALLNYLKFVFRLHASVTP
jgi:hypothetical protein